MRPSLRLGEIVKRLGGELIGDPDIRINQVAALGSAGDGQISFFSQGKYREELLATQAAAVIVGEAERDATTRPRIVCRDPYFYFAQISLLLNPPIPVQPGIHPSAIVALGANIDPSAHVGAGCVIESEVCIKANVSIGPGSIIGAGCKIGKDSRLYSRVSLYPGCTLGQRVIIHSGAVLGADGFGYAPHEGGWLKIPQIGSVRIGDDVEIGANTTIDRGALDDTIIENGVKLDNQIQIGHNVHIGEHTAVAGCTGRCS